MPGPQPMFVPGEGPAGNARFPAMPEGNEGMAYSRRWTISGVTRDSNGAALAGCVVHLYRAVDDVEIDQAVSDAGGNYAFFSVTPGYAYYVVAYLAGSPDVFGTTVNTLAGV